MAKRRELVYELITDLGYDPVILLESLVAALPERDCLQALQFIMRIEDWNHRLDDDFNLITLENEDA